MLSEFSYPIICSEKYAKTVSFYEDHFNFIPEYELPDFVVLKRKNWDNAYLAIMSHTHTAIPEEFRHPTQGVIINYPVKNVDAFYQKLYWEGLDLMTGPEVAACSRKHFLVKDPNGILIDIAQNVSADKKSTKNKDQNLCKECV